MLSHGGDRLSTSFLSSDFWENRYQENTARWDLGQPALAFVDWLTDRQPQPGRMMVLGAGRGHDALWFASHGFEVVGVDFAPSAVEQARALAQEQQLSAQFEQHNIFELPDDWHHSFDYVLEHTCFCAIAPEQRPAYVQVVQQLLKPTGQFIGLFWAHDRPGGPPFGSRVADIQSLFSEHFDVSSLKPVARSVPQRQGEEYLAQFPMKGAIARHA
ncbi:MAG: methyltransferase domain-containing protein [Elainellaceae cyanobacterium]